MTIKDNKTVNFIYQDTQIHFLLNSTDENVMVNATEMAKLFDRRTEDFTKTKNTKKFISALERALIRAHSESKSNSEQTLISVHSDIESNSEHTEMSVHSESESPLNGGRSNFKIMEDRGHMGMYFERRLALKFAAWLDVEFELWVYSTIDKILFGNLKEYRDAMKQEVAAQKLRKPLTYNLKNNPCKETVEAYFKNEELLNDAKKRKRKATENQKSLFEQDFVINKNKEGKSTH